MSDVQLQIFMNVFESAPPLEQFEKFWKGVIEKMKSGAGAGAHDSEYASPHECLLFYNSRQDHPDNTGIKFINYIIHDHDKGLVFATDPTSNTKLNEILDKGYEGDHKKMIKISPGTLSINCGRFMLTSCQLLHLQVATWRRKLSVTQFH